MEGGNVQVFGCGNITGHGGEKGRGGRRKIGTKNRKITGWVDGHGLDEGVVLGKRRHTLINVIQSERQEMSMAWKAKGLSEMLMIDHPCVQARDI